MQDTLRIGTTAPSFEAKDQGGDIHRLSDYRGRWLVLFFYPKDRTIHCTIEACAFRNRNEDFLQEDAAVLGISRDDVESHEDFARRRRLSYPLLADPTGAIMDAYDARGHFGRPRRITYIIDPEGRIAHVYRRVRGGSHAKAVLSDIRALKAKRGKPVQPQTLVAVAST